MRGTLPSSDIVFSFVVRFKRQRDMAVLKGGWGCMFEERGELRDERRVGRHCSSNCNITWLCDLFRCNVWCNIRKGRGDAVQSSIANLGSVRTGAEIMSRSISIRTKATCMDGIVESTGKAMLFLNIKCSSWVVPSQRVNKEVPQKHFSFMRFILDTQSDTVSKSIRNVISYHRQIFMRLDYISNKMSQ